MIIFGEGGSIGVKIYKDFGEPQATLRHLEILLNSIPLTVLGRGITPLVTSKKTQFQKFIWIVCTQY